MRWIAAAMVGLLACGGSSQTTSEEPKPGGSAGSADSGELSPEDRLYRSQLATCGPVCERITQCSVEQARANLSDAELAKLDLERTAPEHTRRCQRKCDASRLSPRQVKVMRQCVNGPQDCASYLDCLDAAKKGGG